MLNQIDEQFSVRLVCRNCRDEIPNIIEDFSSGDLVCGDCGLVLGDRIVDTRSEWRTFADSEGDDPSRVGNSANPFLDGDQLDTLIVRGNNDAGLSRHLNRTQGRAKDQQHQSALIHGYQEITALCGAFDIPKSIVDIAKQLYKKVTDENLQRGRSNDAVIAVCIFQACRQSGAPRTFKEICALTKVSLKEVSRTLKVLKDKFKDDTTLTSSKDLLERFCSNLKLDNEVWRIATILNNSAADLENISGKNPTSIASACIFMASQLVGQSRDAKLISKISGIGEPTIKSTYKILYTHRKELLIADIMDRNPKALESNLTQP